MLWSNTDIGSIKTQDKVYKEFQNTVGWGRPGRGVIQDPGQSMIALLFPHENKTLGNCNTSEHDNNSISGLAG